MPAKKRLFIVVGARPQIMKAAALAHALESFPNLEYEIIHSGQHYDASLSGSFFSEFGLKAPLYNFEIGSLPHNTFIAQFLLSFDPILTQEKPDLVIVVGDTNTTAAAAIAVAKRNIPLAHVEAGLREWDKAIPEEVNKLITDAVSDLFFSPTKTGVENLIKQGVTKKVYNTGDITLDLLVDDRYVLSEQIIRERYKIKGDYIYMTCHRERNTSDPQLLKNIVDAVNELDYSIVWTLHPRTKKALIEFNLMDSIKSHIQLIEPIGYSASQGLIRHAFKVITDSGGVIKEAYFHKTPAVIIDTQTEWIETVEEGWHNITGPDKEGIITSIKSQVKPEIHTQALGDGSAGYRIIRAIERYLS